MEAPDETPSCAPSASCGAWAQPVHRPRADFARAVGSARRGFRLDIYEDARGERLETRGRRLAAAARALARFGRGDPGYAEGLSLGPVTSVARERPGAAALLALAVFGASRKDPAFVKVEGVTLTRPGPRSSQRRRTS